MKNVKTATAAKKADEKKTPQMAVVKKGEAKKAPSIIERLQQAEEQGKLAQQWQRLQNYRKRLDSFHFSDEQSSQLLVIKADDLEFRTSKTEHLELVITDLIQLIDKKISEVESKLQ